MSARPWDGRTRRVVRVLSRQLLRVNGYTSNPGARELLECGHVHVRTVPLSSGWHERQWRVCRECPQAQADAR